MFCKRLQAILTEGMYMGYSRSEHRDSISEWYQSDTLKKAKKGFIHGNQPGSDAIRHVKTCRAVVHPL